MTVQNQRLNNSLDQRHLLVVGSDPETSASIVLALQAHGAEVEAVTTLHEGLAAIQRRRPDVLLSHLSLPDGDGYSLLNTVRVLEAEQHLEKVPAIAISASVRQMNAMGAVDAGFQRYLSEPIEPHRLIAAVVSLIHYQVDHSLS